MCLRSALDDHRTDGEVGDEVAVHHVDMEQVGRFGDAIHLGRELSEVGGQDRRRRVLARVLPGTPGLTGACVPPSETIRTVNRFEGARSLLPELDDVGADEAGGVGAEVGDHLGDLLG